MILYRRSMLLALASVAYAMPAPAQEAGGPIILDTVTVTGTRTETSVRRNPASISVITEDQIERSGAANIADILRDVPGITIDESSLAGLKRLKIRGEEARRGAVLIDGQEITDHTSYGAPILIDPALIERIEVVRGPHSVLYGSKAIGGVVNIITKKGGDRPFQGSVGASYLSATTGYTANGLVQGTSGGWAYRLFAGRVEEGDRETPSGKLPNTNSDGTNLSGYLAYAWDAHKIAAFIDRYELSAGSFTSPSTLGTAFSEFQLDMPRRDLLKFGANYEWDRPSALIAKVQLDAYYQTIDREFTQLVAAGPVIPPPARYDYRHGDNDTQDTVGATAQINWTPHPDHLLITGAQFLRDDLDKSLRRTGRRGFGLATPVNLYADMEAYTQTFSVFAEDTWTLPSDFSLVFGGRYYWIESALESVRSNDAGFRERSSSDSAPIGTVTLLWSGIPDTTLRAGFAQGYVYPTLVQAFTGSYFGTSVTTRPNPFLEAETSNNIEIGARYAGRNVIVDVALFHSRSEDYITTASCATVPEVGCAAGESTYVNLDKAKTSGVELVTEYRVPRTGFTPYLSGTLLRREYSYRTLDTDETGVPTLSGRIGLRYITLLWDNIGVTADVYMRGATSADEVTQSSTGNVSLTRVDGWKTFNASFGADIGNVRVGLDLLNLTDKEYQTTPDEMPQPGRSVVLSLRTNF